MAIADSDRDEAAPYRPVRCIVTSTTSCVFIGSVSE
jgi:hypothetical protein